MVATAQGRLRAAAAREKRKAEAAVARAEEAQAKKRAREDNHARNAARRSGSTLEILSLGEVRHFSYCKCAPHCWASTALTEHECVAEPGLQ